MNDEDFRERLITTQMPIYTHGLISRGDMSVRPLPGPLLTTRAVAAWLGCTRDQVYVLVKRDGLPCIRIGRCRRYDPAAVQAWLDAKGD